MKTVYILSTVAALAVGASILADEPSAGNNAGNAADPTPPVVSVNASDPTAFRGLSTGAFLIHRNDTNGDLNVNLKIGGTANNGVDYTTLPTSVKIPAGFFSVGLVVSPLGGAQAHLTRLWCSQLIPIPITRSVAPAMRRSKSRPMSTRINRRSSASPVRQTTPRSPRIRICRSPRTRATQMTRSQRLASTRMINSSVRAKRAPYSITWSNVPRGNFAPVRPGRRSIRQIHPLDRGACDRQPTLPRAPLLLS